MSLVLFSSKRRRLSVLLRAWRLTKQCVCASESFAKWPGNQPREALGPGPQTPDLVVASSCRIRPR